MEDQIKQRLKERGHSNEEMGLFNTLASMKKTAGGFFKKASGLPEKLPKPRRGQTEQRRIMVDRHFPRNWERSLRDTLEAVLSHYIECARSGNQRDLLEWYGSEQAKEVSAAIKRDLGTIKTLISNADRFISDKKGAGTPMKKLLDWNCANHPALNRKELYQWFLDNWIGGYGDAQYAFAVFFEK